MDSCVPKVMILGHSFVRRLHKDLEDKFDDRAKRDFDLQDAYIRLFGSGGRTVTKVLQYDLNNVVLFAPDIIILDIGTNDLTVKPPEKVGSDIDDLTRKLISDFSVSIVVVCSVIPRASSTHFNEKARMLNHYLSVVIDSPRLFYWQHCKLLKPKKPVLLADGVHLNPHGQYALYRSYRGAILKALKVLKSV